MLFITVVKLRDKWLRKTWHLVWFLGVSTFLLGVATDQSHEYVRGQVQETKQFDSSKLQLGKDVKKETIPEPPLATENDALALAVEDIKQFPEWEQCEIRYLWVENGNYEWSQAANWVLNHISRSPVIRPAVRLTRGRLMLLRVPVRWYAPSDEDFIDWVGVWEELQFDPRFSLLLTRDTLKFATGIDISKVTNPTQKGVAADVVRLNSPHLDPSLVEYLQEVTYSYAPVVSLRYFVTRASTTIVDKGLYATIYGGLYYRFLNVPSGAKKGTDLDALFEQLGVGNVNAGITAKGLFDKLRSDRRITLTRRNPTGHSGRIDFLRQLAGGIGNTQGLIAVTHDLKRDDIDIGLDPLLNLIDFKASGFEVLWEMANGMMGTGAYGDREQRLDQVGDNIASDRTVADPYNTNLQSGVSCWRCHAQGGGWQKAPLNRSSVKALLAGRTRPLADDNLKNASPADLNDRLAGLYMVIDPEFQLLPKARADYAANSLLASEPWKDDANNAQVNAAKLAAYKFAEVFGDYNYQLVDAQRALFDLGVKASKEDAPDLWKKLILGNQGLPVTGLLLTDARLEILAEGESLTRPQWDLAYSFAASKFKKP